MKRIIALMSIITLVTIFGCDENNVAPIVKPVVTDSITIVDLPNFKTLECKWTDSIHVFSISSTNDKIYLYLWGFDPWLGKGNYEKFFQGGVTNNVFIGYTQYYATTQAIQDTLWMSYNSDSTLNIKFYLFKKDKYYSFKLHRK